MQTQFSQKLKSLFPYFLLAIAIMFAYKIINDLDNFLDLILQLWGIVTPFFYGFILAYILNIPCQSIQHLFDHSKYAFIQKRQKVFSICIVYFTFLLILFLILKWVLPSVYQNTAFFVENFQTYYNNAQQFINYINNLELLNLDLSADSILAMIADLFSFDQLFTSLNALFSVSSAIFNMFLAFISSIYILSEKEKSKSFICRILHVLLPIKAYNTLIKYVNKLNHNFKQYIYTQTIDGFIVGTIITIEMYLLGSPYALTLGIIIAVLNYIPYFGSIIGVIVVIIIAFFSQGLQMAVITAVVLLITQQVDGNIIQPRLMGESFSLSPFLIIVSITIGGAFAGVLGMIAAIPIVAVLKDILEAFIEYLGHKKHA